MPTRNGYSRASVKVALALAATRQLALRDRAASEPSTAYNDPELRRQRTYNDPEWFCREILGVSPYPEQMAIIYAVRDNAQTSLVGANGVGKDWMLGRVVIPWWLESHEEAKVVLTGPTDRQVSQIVWRETRAAFQQSIRPLRGRMLPVEARWEVDAETFAYGFSTDKPHNILGFHSPHLLAIVTEAHNFGDEHLRQVRRWLPERLLLSGNPLATAGEFFGSHHARRHLYKTIKLTAWDSPNVKAQSDVVPGLVTQDDIDKLVAEYGRDSGYVRATIDSEFAETGQGLYPLSWLEAAVSRVPVVWAKKREEPMFSAGVDVAGPGEDETVLQVRQGPNLVESRAWRDADPRGELLAALQPYFNKLDRVNVDAIGIGYYLGLFLADAQFPVNLINVSVPASRPDTTPEGPGFANLKAEAYWVLRERLRSGEVNGLADEKAFAQLSGIQYRHNARGQIVIESKEEAAKRGVESPDRAEAIILSFIEVPPVQRGTLVYEDRVSISPF